MVQSPSEGSTTNWRYLTASEDTDFGQPPTLALTTSGPASQPTVSAPAITPAQTVNGVTVTSSLTPQLAATVADTAQGSLTGQFEVEHDPAATGQGTGQIWTGASQAVASGGQATVSVPAGKLTDGWKIRWRARAANAAASTTSAWSDWQLATVKVPGPVSDPTVGALQVAPSTIVNGQAVTSSLTPTLLAQVSDPAGGSLRAEYAIEHDPGATGQGTGQIWTGAVDNVVSGAQASLAVPEGTLTDGWKVRWRARAVAGEFSSAWSDWQTLTIDVASSTREPLAQTSEPVIYTDDSFTVTAWLRWSDKDGNYTVVEQRGANQAPFHLGNSADHGLEFTFTSADATDATVEGVRSDVEPPVNEWFHLAGVYDKAAKKVSLYLNGQLVKSETISFASWNAERSTTLGTSMLGDLDDVWIYSRALADNEIAVSAGIASAPESSTATKTPKNAATNAASPAVSFSYDRINSVEDCRKSHLSDYRAPANGKPAQNETGFTKNHFAWCVWDTNGLAIRDIRTGNPIHAASFDVVIIGRTFQASRTIEYDLYVLDADDTEIGSAFNGKNFTISMVATGSPSNAACKQVVGGEYQQVYSGTEEYWDDRKVSFKFESPTPAAGGWTSATAEEIATCNFTWRVDAPTVPDIKFNNDWPKWVVRCDSASYINWWKQGCIFKNVVPSIVLKKSDFPWAFEHINNAYQNPTGTIPMPGGPRYTWPSFISGPAPYKDFPGLSKFTPVHRLRDDDRARRNRDRSVSICARYEAQKLGIKWRSSDPVPWDSNVRQCDEFPFASTYEGSWVYWQKTPPKDPGIMYPKNKVNVSVSLIPALENNQWGGFQDGGLGRYYAYDRILDKDAFYVRLKDALGNPVNQ
ncbi:LamG-like jellyroll fold domain-containing protein [Nonomuraea sp. NPDC049695]|uniref:LamG-like jellyroll fold domain-containing protein n=1 Tax=Nonomuraea sp. NPDC049695 TaxID=3154734 RepID=UPI003430FF6E